MANYNVYRDKETGKWAAKREDRDRAGSLSDTQREAERNAKRFSANSGGGEVRIHGRDGKIRDSDTVSPGNDPRSIRDTRH